MATYSDRTISVMHSHLLQVASLSQTQSISGCGSALALLRNPLTQWLKSRKDEQSAERSWQSYIRGRIRLRWQVLTEGLLTPSGQPPSHGV